MIFQSAARPGKKHLGSLENSSQDIAWSQTPLSPQSDPAESGGHHGPLTARATGPCGWCRDGEAICVDGQHRDPSDIKK